MYLDASDLEVELDPIYSKGKERQKRSTSRGYTNKVQGQLNNIPSQVTGSGIAF